MNEAFSRIGREIAVFIAVGLLATAVHYAVALSLTVLLPLTLANPCGFAVALIVSYLGHARLTFSAMAGQISHRERFPRFALVALGGFALNQSIVLILSQTTLPNWLVLGARLPWCRSQPSSLRKFWVFAARKGRTAGDR